MIREDLLTYYENELSFLRQMGAEFAAKYPRIASKLALAPDRCEDPHTERLLEAFAFLAGRVHLKIDDEFPEIATSLLDAVYPHFLRPIPSATVVEFQLDPEQGRISTDLCIRRGSLLYSKGQVENTVCKFQTCYDTTLWPITIAEAQWRTPDLVQPLTSGSNAVGAIRLLLRCLPDVTFQKLGMSTLRFHLRGESKLTHTLYELLCNNCIEVILRDPLTASGTPVRLSSEHLEPVGFAEEEALLPYPLRSFPGYRLLQEYFTLPEKFLFFDLKGLDQLAAKRFGEQAEIIFLIAPFERSDRQAMIESGLFPSTFRLNCSPVVNLASQTAEPILLDQTKYEYPVVPDVRRPFASEVFSIDSVKAVNARRRDVVDFFPFFAYRSVPEADAPQRFWHATRRSPYAQDDARTDVFISVVDLSGQLIHPDADTLTVRCTCTNSDLPARLPFGNPSGDFEAEGFSAVNKIVALRKPTPTYRPPIGKRALWSLVSHLSLNYLSLVEDGREALQHILQLYNFTDEAHLQSQINGIRKVHSDRDFAPIASAHGISPARGVRIQIEFDEEQFVGEGVYLFASILEYYLGMYVSMNSFTRLVAHTSQREEVLREWPPRAGKLILV